MTSRIGDLSYQVPKEWEYGDSSDESTQYYYPEQGMLMVQINDPMDIQRIIVTSTWKELQVHMIQLSH